MMNEFVQQLLQQQQEFQQQQVIQQQLMTTLTNILQGIQSCRESLRMRQSTPLPVIQQRRNVLKEEKLAGDVGFRTRSQNVGIRLEKSGNGTLDHLYFLFYFSSSILLISV